MAPWCPLAELELSPFFGPLLLGYPVTLTPSLAASSSHCALFLKNQGRVGYWGEELGGNATSGVQKPTLGNLRIEGDKGRREIGSLLVSQERAGQECLSRV